SLMSPLLCISRTPPPTLFPYTTLFRSAANVSNMTYLPNTKLQEFLDLGQVITVNGGSAGTPGDMLSPTDPTQAAALIGTTAGFQDRKSTRLNSSHVKISYAVFCLKKKK